MNKFRSYSFWISVAGAVGIVFNNIGKYFGFSFDSQILTNIVDSVCGVLILFGIITISKSDNSGDEYSNNIDSENIQISDNNQKSQNNDDKNNNSKSNKN